MNSGSGSAVSRQLALTERQERDLDWIRTYYEVPESLTIGTRVRFEGRLGTVIDTSDGRLQIVLDAAKPFPIHVHPTWEMEYVDAQ